MSAWYVVGVLASVFHLANGIWTMGITWGVWVSPAAQHRASLACGVFGVGLAVVGVSAIAGFWQVDVPSAWQQEQTIYQQNVQAGWIEPDEHKRMPPPTEGVR
jgi:succinate dehydrogenase / fumarate reductase cytochrome b subunit